MNAYPIKLERAPLKNGWYRLLYQEKIQLGKSEDYPLTPTSKLVIHTNSTNYQTITAKDAVFFNHIF
jgi:hypothetical protein